MGHHHHHDNEKADFWTIANTAAEGTTSFISDSYWLASVFDLCTGLEKDFLGVSKYGAAFGLTLALVSAGGSALCHLNLNTLLQPDTHVHTPNCSHNKPTQEYCQVIPPPTNEERLEAQINDKSSAPLLTPAKSETIHWWQKLALAGDWLAHTGDIAGPLTFVVELATVSNPLSRGAKIGVQCGASFFGAVGAYAQMRSCREAIIEMNRKNI